MVGIPLNRAILVEFFLLIFKNLAAVTTIPALEAPGINEKLCKIPIKMDSFKDNSNIVLLLLGNLSAINNKSAPIILAHPKISKLSKKLSRVLNIKNPKIITGAVIIIILNNLTDYRSNT